MKKRCNRCGTTEGTYVSVSENAFNNGTFGLAYCKNCHIWMQKRHEHKNNMINLEKKPLYPNGLRPTSGGANGELNAIIPFQPYNPFPFLPDQTDTSTDNTDRASLIPVKRETALTFDSYQRGALKTAIYPDRGNNLYYPALGLGGEAGEVLNKVKKIMRDCNGVLTDEKRTEIGKEIGGVLWYAAALADECGLNLGEIAQENLDILTSRQKRGTLRGDGDNR